MLRSDPDHAGRYADQGGYGLTDAGRHAFPSPAEVPALMGAFGAWLGTATEGPISAFRAHRRSVDIHPFNDGNGRTARLLMNLLLLRDRYPPVAVRPIDRAAYLSALQEPQADDGRDAFHRFLLSRLDETLAETVEAIRQTIPPS